jgi:membrane protein DedA with SNARE-associated domain
LQEWIIQIMDQFGYIGIAFLIALENIFPPIPSEVILTFGGFMTTYTKLTPWGVIIASTIGSVLGAVVLYWIGRSFTPERLEYWLEGRLSRILRLKKGDVARAKGWFERHGKRAVFFCRCIPLIRSLISIPAGMAKMKMWLFLLLTIAGSLIWNSTLIYLGVALGASWEIIISYTNIYAITALSVLGVILLVFAIIYFKKRSRCNNE